MASKTPVKVVAESAAVAYAYLQRCLHFIEGPDAESVDAIANDSLQAALTDFSTKKKSKLTKSFFPPAENTAMTWIIPNALPVRPESLCSFITSIEYPFKTSDILMRARKVIALGLASMAVQVGIPTLAQEGQEVFAPAPESASAAAPAPEAIDTVLTEVVAEPAPIPVPEPTPVEIVLPESVPTPEAEAVPPPTEVPNPDAAPAQVQSPVPDPLLSPSPSPVVQSPSPLPSPSSPPPSSPPPSSPPPSSPPPPVFVPVPVYVEVPAKCQELSAEAESIASAEGACDSEAFAVARATAIISCSADGSQSLSVEANAEALAALEAKCGAPSDTPCTDAFTDMANAAWVYGCESPAFAEADMNAKNACGYTIYSLLQSHLSICVRPIPVAPPTSGAVDSAGGASCAELIVQASAAAEMSGCDSEAYTNAQTSAEVVCAVDAVSTAEDALARLASSCEYSLGSSIQENDCYSAFTDLLTSSRINGCASPEYRLADDLAKRTCSEDAYWDLKDLTGVCDISVAGGNSTIPDAGHAPGALVAALVASLVVALA